MRVEVVLIERGPQCRQCDVAAPGQELEEQVRCNLQDCRPQTGVTWSEHLSAACDTEGLQIVTDWAPLERHVRCFLGRLEGLKMTIVTSVRVRWILLTAVGVSLLAGAVEAKNAKRCARICTDEIAACQVSCTGKGKARRHCKSSCKRSIVNACNANPEPGCLPAGALPPTPGEPPPTQPPAPTPMCPNSLTCARFLEANRGDPNVRPGLTAPMPPDFPGLPAGSSTCAAIGREGSSTLPSNVIEFAGAEDAFYAAVLANAVAQGWVKVDANSSETPCARALTFRKGDEGVFISTQRGLYVVSPNF